MKKSMIAALAVATMGAGAVGVGTTYAASNTSPASPFGDLIEAIATRFNLSTEDVQQVFEEQRKAHQEEMQAKGAERLADAVTNGEITQEQADAITAHREEMQTFHESLKEMSEEDRQAAIETQKEENKTWAEENNIPEQFLMHEGPHGHEGPDRMGPPRNGQFRQNAN